MPAKGTAQALCRRRRSRCRFGTVPATRASPGAAHQPAGTPLALVSQKPAVGRAHVDSDLERGCNGVPLGRKAVACDADFKRYAVDDGQESVIVSQITDDRELFRLSGVGDLREIPFLRFSPDGRLLAVRHEAGP